MSDKSAQERCDEVLARATAELDAILADYPGLWWTTDDGQELRAIVCGPMQDLATATCPACGTNYRADLHCPRCDR